MRTLLRAILVLVLIVVAGFLILGFVAGSSLTWRRDHRTERPTATSGTVNPETARERGAEIGEKAAVAADRVQAVAHDAELTSKIKAKMALDDSVRSRSIDVSTTGSVVTLSGTVRSVEEHSRALALARDTAGITKVIDHLTVDR